MVKVKRKKTDPSKYEELSEALQVYLNEFEKEGTFSNTLERGKAVAAYLNGEGTAAEIGTRYDFSTSQVSKLSKSYREGGIEALKAKEWRPLKRKKTDTSKDAELSKALQLELNEFEKEGTFSKTLKRGKAVVAYLNGEGTAAEIGALYGISGKVVSSLSQSYRKGGIKALKAKEAYPLKRKKTDPSKDAELSEALQLKLSEFEKEGTFSNTLKRGKAVAAYLNGEGTAAEIGTLYGLSTSQVSSLSQSYRKGGIEALKAKEAYPLKRKKTDTSEDAELSEALQLELNEFEKEGTFSNTLKRGKAVVAYLNGEGTAAEIGTLYGISGNAVSSLSQSYREGGIEALKAKEWCPLKRKKIDTSKDARAKAQKKPQNGIGTEQLIVLAGQAQNSDKKITNPPSNSPAITHLNRPSKRPKNSLN